MDEFFESLVERAQYYELFEFFREDCQKVQVKLDTSGQLGEEKIVVELILNQK